MSANVLNRSEVSALFMLSFESRLASAGINDYVDLVSSSTASSRYGLLLSPPAMQRRRGMLPYQTPSGFTIDIANDTWDAGIGIDINDWRRDQTGTLRRYMADFGAAAAELPLEQIETLMSAGNGSTAGLAWDGKNFYAGSGAPHVIDRSGNIINNVTASEVPTLNVAAGSNVPTPEEAAVLMMDLIAYSMSWKDDQGRPINRSPRKFKFVTSPDHWAAFNTAASANFLNSLRDNVLARQFQIDVVMGNASTGAAGFMHICDSSRKPFVIQQEKALALHVFDESNDAKRTITEQKMLVHAEWHGGYAFADFTKSLRYTLS